MVRALHYGVLHQTIYGAIAAAGFGVLFNFGYANIACAGVAGAIALGVRSVGLEVGWTLEAASFCAAIAVALVVWSWSGSCLSASARPARRWRSRAAFP